MYEIYVSYTHYHNFDSYHTLMKGTVSTYEEFCVNTSFKTYSLVLVSFVKISFTQINPSVYKLSQF